MKEEKLPRIHYRQLVGDIFQGRIINMRKILFLDIDGVLNTERQQWHCQMEGIAPIDRFGYSFDPKAVSNLATILSATKAEIVLSSSWKFYGLDILRQMWTNRGLPGEITDITPSNISDDLLLNADLENMDLLPGKGTEIKEWLVKHQNQVSHYAIIDDIDDMLPEQQAHFVQTNPQFGITRKDVAKVIQIFT